MDRESWTSTTLYEKLQNFFPLSLNNCFKGNFCFVIDHSSVIVKPSIRKLPTTRQCINLIDKDYVYVFSFILFIKHFGMLCPNVGELCVYFQAISSLEEAVVQRYYVKKVFLEQETKRTRDWHRCFPVNFAKFLSTPFFIEHLWWLLLLMFIWSLTSIFL